MDSTARSKFLEDLHTWGGSLYYLHGWRLPYWELEDWRQYAVEWALRIIQRYDTDTLLSSAHAFSLTKTSIIRDIYDQTHSVNQTEELTEHQELVQKDTSWIFCIPQEAEELAVAVLSVPLELWEAAEQEWKSAGRKKLATSVAGLAFLLHWPEKRVQRSIVALQNHILQ